VPSKSSKRKPVSAPSSSWSAFDHRADVYARRVLGDRTAGEPIVAGPLVRAACERHLRDRKGIAGFWFDAEAADHIISFFEHVLVLPDMLNEDGQPLPFLLQPFQVFIVGSLFGWRKTDGSRRFREAYIEIGKGNGKTPLCAGIGLYGLFMDNERAAEIYAAASDQTQAQTLFRYAVNMVKVNTELEADLHLSGGNEIWKIEHLPSLSFFRTFSRESGAKSGPIPHMGLLDELHEHGSAQISIKIRAGAKRRRNALFLEITNSGFDRTTICWQHHEHSRKILEGVIPDDSQWFAFVCNLDAGDDPLADESCWLKVNPNLGVSIGMDYLRRQVSNARNIPAETNTVLRLNFCVWTQANDRFLDSLQWQACGALTVSEDELLDAPCFGAFDLGETDDMTAWVLVWVLDDGRVYVKCRFWVPRGAFTRFPDRPYPEWERAGVLEVTDGESTDLSVVEEAIAEDARRYGPKEIGFDKYAARQMSQHLAGRGLQLVDVPQGFFLSEAVKRLSALVVGGQLVHGNNAVLTWMADNAIIQHGNEKRIRLDKDESKDKIDGIVALVMALLLWVKQPQDQPVEVSAWLA
jgi:phage terminase large subunit-like protein